MLVAGSFVTPHEEAEFQRILAQTAQPELIQHLGFVSGEKKHQLLREADLFCFPTFFQNENQPVNLIEAMAFGLPILTTRWRSLPELFPPGYAGLVKVRSPEQVAEVLLGLATSESGEGFRDIFLRTYKLETHLSRLADAFHYAESDARAAIPAAGFSPQGRPSG